MLSLIGHYVGSKGNEEAQGVDGERTQPLNDPSQKNRRSRRRPVLSRAFVVIVVLSALVPLFILQTWHESYVRQNVESPLDHVGSALRRPFRWRGCPSRAIDRIGDIEEFLLPSRMQSFPPITIISARPKEDTMDVRASWDDLSNITDDLSIAIHTVDTREMSKGFKRFDGEASSCRGYLERLDAKSGLRSKTASTGTPTLSFEGILFSVYKRVMADALVFHPNAESFVFLEDDAKLLDAEQFVKEVGVAMQRRYQFYSFFLTGKQQQKGSERKEPTCSYEHGTVAFLIKRRLMQAIIDADERVACGRLGIDMFIASRGPWFATTKGPVVHVGKRIHVNRRHLRQMFPDFLNFIGRTLQSILGFW
mmetsp:Transcript_22522/g.64781  ORF Transcript_22522/g.64781 Transcript_22522/m.64781 type:complete len:365 (-) Transcript_22522:101-1195(-)